MLQSDIKNINKRIIFDLYREHGELTRVEVARMSGISMPSVIKAVASLTESGILEQLGARQTTVGRKPLELRFNPDAISAFGVDYEGERLSVGLVKIDGTVETMVERNTKTGMQHRVADDVIECVRGILDKTDVSQRQIAGIGFGIPGVVNAADRSIAFAPIVGVNAPIDLEPVLRRIEEATSLPTYIDNDANVRALGELVTRRVRHHERTPDLVYLQHGTGLGAGMVLNGEVRHGTHNHCGEIGYYVSTANAPAARNESGWLERQLNTRALREKFGFDIHNPTRQSEVIDYIIEMLTPAIANVVMLIDIDLVIYGGIIVDALGEELISRMAASVNRVSFKEVRIERQLAERPGIVGAAAIVIDQKLDQLV